MNSVMFEDETVVPSKVVCIGRNYVEHILELNNEIPENMVIFNKPNSAITDELKYINDTTRYEGEICFLIKNSQIAGVGFGLDLTDANIQNKMKKKGLPWERAKSFDSSAVLGKFVNLEENIEFLRFELYVNDKLIQIATYGLMIYKPFEMLKEINGFMTLEDGDIIMSGTPKGVGYYCKGDKFLGQIFSNNKLLVSSAWIVV